MSLRNLIVRNRNNNLINRSEFKPFDSFQREFDKMFDGFFSNFDLAPSSVFKREGSSFSPDINISEDEKSFEISAELPGLDEKDLKVSLVDGILSIEGEKKREEKEKKKEYYRVERSFGKFKRSIRVPEEVEVDSINASFKNGVLQVSLPKSEKAQEKVRKIEVKSA